MGNVAKLLDKMQLSQRWEDSSPQLPQTSRLGSHFNVRVPSACVLSPTAWVRDSFFLSS